MVLEDIRNIPREKIKKEEHEKKKKKQENIILLASSGIITKTLQNRKAVKNRKLLKQNSTENFTENVSGKEQKKTKELTITILHITFTHLKLGEYRLLYRIVSSFNVLLKKFKIYCGKMLFLKQ